MCIHILCDIHIHIDAYSLLRWLLAGVSEDLESYPLEMLMDLCDGLGLDSDGSADQLISRLDDL